MRAQRERHFNSKLAVHEHSNTLIIEQAVIIVFTPSTHPCMACSQMLLYYMHNKTIPAPAAMHPSLLYSCIPAFIPGKNRQWHTKYMYDAANM